MWQNMLSAVLPVWIPRMKLFPKPRLASSITPTVVEGTYPYPFPISFILWLLLRRVDRGGDFDSTFALAIKIETNPRLSERAL